MQQAKVSLLDEAKPAERMALIGGGGKRALDVDDEDEVYETYGN